MSLILSTPSGSAIDFEGWYRERSCFLLLNGPSLTTFNLELLRQRGIVTACVNNGWGLFKPNIWIAVDPPGNFADAGWKDPSIMKFVPKSHFGQHIHEKLETGEFRVTEQTVSDMPSVIGYPTNTRFQIGTFLTEGSVNYGNRTGLADELGNVGSRSVMLAALRILYYLGFRNVYLVGADFRMSNNQPYAFPQDKGPGGVAGNNNTYRILNSRLKALKPVFEANGFHVFNCTKDSGLEAFPYADFEESIKNVAGSLTKPIDTKGWYGNLKADQAPKPAVWKGRITKRAHKLKAPTGKGKRR